VSVAVLPLLLSLSIAAEPAAAAPPTPAEAQVRALEEKRQGAIRGGDRATLEALYADDFHGVTSAGFDVDKAAILRVLSRTDPSTRFSTEELKVRAIGEAAVAEGRIVGRAGEGRVLVDFRYLHVWAKRDGAWKIVAGQSTPSPPAFPHYPASPAAAKRLPASAFDYDRKASFAVETTGQSTKDGVAIREIRYAGAAGKKVGATLVSPPGRGKGPGVLFVHWYAPPSPDSNRTQFLEEAVTLAKSGATSLLIDTMWSEAEWFLQRKTSEDYAASVAQVRELSRALDLLLAQPGVDPARVAYVGHDFGAMYGALLAGIDLRPSLWAMQAGTSSFADWFLLNQRLEGEARQKIVDELAPLEPVLYIGAAAPAPVLFQFGDVDPYVPKTSADVFVAAAGEPKKVIWYEAGHELDAKARSDRIAWLKEKLRI
jgi:ketosteroid isomerase-like protein/dienelactone hydrolase